MELQQYYFLEITGFPSCNVQYAHTDNFYQLTLVTESYSIVIYIPWQRIFSVLNRL